MRAVEVAAGVFRLPLAPAGALNCFALVDADGGVTLIDAGLRRSGKRLARGLEELGKGLPDVRRIVLTHAHADHAGGLAAAAEASAAPVSAHEREAVYVRDGRVPPFERGGPAKRLFPRKFPPVTVAETFRDGDVLPYAGGLRVVATPGHTPGHVSLLHEATGTLLLGDALMNLRDLLRYPMAMACTSVPLSRQSADKLAELDFDAAGFAHGSDIRSGAREAVLAFTRGRRR